MMSPITTHVLDTALGSPAEAISVTLYRQESGGQNVEIGHGETNSEGRVTDLLPAGAIPKGTYQIEFDTASYFTRSGRESFYPRIAVLFEVATSEQHYHVPLLLSPFGYSTYRGS